MRLHIAPNNLISDVQKEFNNAFPYLKLEFFSNKPYLQEINSKRIIPGNWKIGDSQAVITKGDIEITGDMRVKELEQLIKDQFSLLVQVFRKSGNVWLQTTITDNWTLSQQNNHGKELAA